MPDDKALPLVLGPDDRHTFAEINEAAQSAEKQGRLSLALYYYSKAGDEADRNNRHKHAYSNYRKAVELGKRLLKEVTAPEALESVEMRVSYNLLFAGSSALRLSKRVRSFEGGSDRVDDWWERALGNFVEAKTHIKNLVRDGVDVGKLRGLYGQKVAMLDDPVVEEMLRQIDTTAVRLR